jgi:hypothetical protein
MKRSILSILSLVIIFTTSAQAETYNQPPGYNADRIEQIRNQFKAIHIRVLEDSSWILENTDKEMHPCDKELHAKIGAMLGNYNIFQRKMDRLTRQDRIWIHESKFLETLLEEMTVNVDQVKYVLRQYTDGERLNDVLKKCEQVGEESVIQLHKQQFYQEVPEPNGPNIE